MELEGREGSGRQDLEDRKNAELIDTEKKDAESAYGCLPIDSVYGD